MASKSEKEREEEDYEDNLTGRPFIYTWIEQTIRGESACLDLLERLVSEKEDIDAEAALDFIHEWTHCFSSPHQKVQIGDFKCKEKVCQTLDSRRLQDICSNLNNIK